MIKVLNKVIKGMYLNLIKTTHDKLIVNIILNLENSRIAVFW
jgi:hypothetical protein